MDAWLKSAHSPHLIQYVLACDSDDEVSCVGTWADSVDLVVNPPDPDWSTATRNWNAASAASKGDLLMVIADDLFPPVDWDETVRRCCAPLDPLTVTFAMKVADGSSSRLLLRHPIVSRRFFEEFGLFNPDFHGLFCDSDITVRAFWKSMIIDATTLELEHRNPILSPQVVATRSHRRANRPDEYSHGVQVLQQSWSRLERHAPAVMLSAADIATLSHRQLTRQLRGIRYRAALHGLLGLLVGQMRRRKQVLQRRTVPDRSRPTFSERDDFA
jgi:hypothetical protein